MSQLLWSSYRLLPMVFNSWIVCSFVFKKKSLNKSFPCAVDVVVNSLMPFRCSSHRNVFTCDISHTKEHQPLFLGLKHACVFLCQNWHLEENVPSTIADNLFWKLPDLLWLVLHSKRIKASHAIGYRM